MDQTEITQANHLLKIFLIKYTTSWENLILRDLKNFFNNYFIKLAGTKDLQNQIIKGEDEDEIVESWQNKLNIYKRMRMKYLIYNWNFNEEKSFRIQRCWN